MEQVNARCGEVIEGAGPKILDRVASSRRATREKAIQVLTEKLDPTSIVDKTVYQALPIEIAKRGDIVAAIWYMETIGKRGQHISIEIFGSIFQDAMRERNECLENGDEEAMYVVEKSIESLFRMALKHPEFKEQEEQLRMMLGKYHETKGDRFKAIEHYNIALGYQNIDAHISLARMYEKTGALDMSFGILDIGYALFGDIQLLSEMVRISYKMGNITGAINLYRELEKKAKGQEKYKVQPFIYYKGYIEDEQDIMKLEEAIARSLLQQDFTPTEDIRSLMLSAREYIEREIQKENESIRYVDSMETSQWGDAKYHLYNRAIVQRLWLMQIDILTLGNDRYLQPYLRDIRKLCVDGTINSQELLKIFFEKHFSQKLLIEREAGRASKEEGDEDDPKNMDKGEEVEKMRMGGYRRDNDQEEGEKIELYEAVSIHIAGIGELFHHPEYYDLHEGDIADILTHAAIQDGEYNQEFEKSLANEIGHLRDETHYYLGLRSHVVNSYVRFVKQFDEKYGVYYRRHIQSLSIRSYTSLESYPAILKKNPEAALLFWIEKIINNTFPTNDPREIDQIVMEYRLDRLNIKNTLLFGSLIFDASSIYAIGHLADYPNMLDVPEAIYIITEGIRQMNSRDRNVCIRDLHKICQEEYGARGFFDHVRVTFEEIAKMIELDEEHGEEECVSAEDKEICLLVRGNVSILQRKEQIESIINFSVAASEFGSVEGFLQAGDSYKNMGEYDRALHCYECAFMQEDAITSLTKILGCTIEAGRYDEAEKYIHLANQRGYSIGNYILAFYLWQGKTEQAFKQMIYMIKTKQRLIDVPEGLPSLLLETIDFVCVTPAAHDFATENLTVQALYIKSCLTNDPSGKPNPEILLMHLRYCVATIREYKGSELDNVVQSMITPFTGEIDDIDRLNNPNMNDSIEYIDSHAQRVLSSFEKIISDEKDEKRKKELWEYMNEIKMLAISALKKFKGSDLYIAKWRTRLNFRVLGYDYITQEMEDGIPPSAKYIH